MLSWEYSHSTEPDEGHKPIAYFIIPSTKVDGIFVYLNITFVAQIKEQ